MKEITIIGANTHQLRVAGTLGTWGKSDLIIQGPEEMSVSDGFHTFDELYDHRITLYIALCNALEGINMVSTRENMTHGRFPVWRSKKHSDGELCFGTGTQFVLGIYKEAGQQITYHIPIERWDETDFAETLEIAPEWDKHTSEDVLKRLKKI